MGMMTAGRTSIAGLLVAAGSAATVAAFGGLGGIGSPGPSLPSAPAAKPAVPGAAATPSPKDRGAYLAGILGCAGCHTPWGKDGMDEAMLYAGTAPHETGESGTPNITPDGKTGIGGWTDAQIIAAIRDAKRPDGSKLSPHMPSGTYHGLTDADAAALVAFLRSIKPVANEIVRVKPDPAEVAKWPPISTATGFTDPADPAGHGGYLAGLLKCEGCHTPPADSKAAGKRYAGGKEFRGRGPDARMLTASNITPDPKTGIGLWTADDIAAAITELVRPDGSKIKGPMNFHADDWAQLSDADAKAIGAFLKSLPAVRHKVGGPITATPAGGKAVTPKKK